MSIYTTSLPQSCDYLIIGGGSAGAILARRLADANIGEIVLIEAGVNDYGKTEIEHLSRLDQQTDATEWGFTAYPVSDRENQIHYARAKMLGGCGNHNDCAFLEPHDSDIDRWQTLGAQGWTAKSCRQYFDRISEMVAIEQNPPVSPISKTFVKAVMECGLESRNFRERIQPGVGSFPLNANGDYRQSSSQSYLHRNFANLKNLTICCETRALKIWFKNGKAIGCETTAGDIRVNAEILVTCGAIQTPQLLMLSGIGCVDQLQRHKIKSVINLPGVGKNLVDHASANVIASLKEPMPDWQLTCCEVSTMLSTIPNQTIPDLLYHFVLGTRDKYVGRKSDFSNAVKISPNVCRPKSRGELQLGSSHIDDQPRVNLNYFSDRDNEDMEKMIYGLKFSRKILYTNAMREIIDTELLPGNSITTDTEWEEYVRDTCETVYHPSGTCKMGLINNTDTVVDPSLKVKGIDNLRVCDASVFPDMVSVNINNTVMMVAERASEIIIDAALVDMYH